MRSLLVAIISSIILLFSSFVSWYEGSALLTTSWEWEDTAIFTKMVKGTIDSPTAILPIDHFVFAAKFSPFFPLLMLVSGFLLLWQAVSWLGKDNRLLMSIFYGFTLFSSIFVIFLVKDSPTNGLQMLSCFFLVLAALSLGLIVRLTMGRVRNSSL
ncbi:DUF4306 domain-containing protein [Sporosarcina sp. Te-1]|uniref:DUF4306 domain-containing protein n=1 Tax=Sporosarcina sp. Te-1 TaxID=2818390 RepID=UPI001A9ED4DB|nr:DUF4306 domain-containing protein [Sporosarcina sp. Te-1]QTD40326.1 DUF4306 domain-containing protein [Sporosarcina sp. Te-1]